MSIEFHVIDIICNTAEYLCVLLFFNNFLKAKALNKRYLVLTGFVFMLLCTAINIPRIPILNTIGVYTLVFCVALILHRGDIINKLAFAAVFITLSASAEICMGFLYYSYMLVGLEAYKNDLFTYAFNAIPGKIILYLIILFLIKKFPHKYLSINTRDIASLAIFPVFGMIATYILFGISSMVQLTTFQNLTISFFLLGLLATSIMVFFVYNSAMQKKELENQLAMSQKIHQMNEALFKEQQRSMEAGRRYIHDFKNHLRNIRALYQSDNAQALDYEEKLIRQLDKQALYKLIDVNNYVISNIFERVRQQCEMDDIALTMEIRYNRLDFLDNLDASSLLDNIFDNALYACSEVESGRRISVKLNRVNDFVVLVVTNTKKNPVISKDGHFLSTRRRYKERGLGIENIIATAKKYGGDAVMTHTDDEFTVTVRLEARS